MATDRSPEELVAAGHKIAGSVKVKEKWCERCFRGNHHCQDADCECPVADCQDRPAKK